MRIHSDHLTFSDFSGLTDGLPGVYVTVSQHGSRSHARSFEISLDGNGYRKNTGTMGAGDEIGATWDEWGVFIARVFNLDANAVFGTVKRPIYANAADFHAQTGGRFKSLNMPTDTHKRHAWEYVARPREFKCKKCTARKYHPAR